MRMPFTPPEIIEHIFSFIPTSDTPTFFALCLTSQTFHSLSINLLYREPRIETSSQAVRLGRCLRGGLGRTLISIRFAGAQKTVGFPIGVLEDLIEISKGTIKELSFENVATSCVGHALVRPGQLERLQFVSCDLHVPFTIQQHGALITAQSLSLENVQMNGNSFLGKSFELLTSISISFTSRTGISRNLLPIMNFLATLPAPSNLRSLKVLLGKSWKRILKHPQCTNNNWMRAVGHFTELKELELDWVPIVEPVELESPLLPSMMGGLLRFMRPSSQLKQVTFHCCYRSWPAEMLGWIFFFSTEDCPFEYFERITFFPPPIPFKGGSSVLTEDEEHQIHQILNDFGVRGIALKILGRNYPEGMADIWTPKSEKKKDRRKKMIAREFSDF